MQAFQNFFEQIYLIYQFVFYINPSTSNFLFVNKNNGKKARSINKFKDSLEYHELLCSPIT